MIARLDEAQIANARMNDMHDVWQHPQLKARGRWTEVGTPGGPDPALLPPGQHRTPSRRAWTPCPRSANTPTPILAELGWRSEIERAARVQGAI